MQIAFTGSRQLSKQEEKFLYLEFNRFVSYHQASWHVGDAPGLDNFVRRAAPYYQKQLSVYEVHGNEPWQFAERSQRMIDAIAGQPLSWLYAFPNKPCPEGCKPCKNPSGKGSGTWLTIAYAHYCGLKVLLFPLTNEVSESRWMPDWWFLPQTKEDTAQLSLF